jgi:hypothetical protein
MEPGALWCSQLFISFNCLDWTYPCHLGNNGAGNLTCNCHGNDGMPHIWSGPRCFLLHSGVHIIQHGVSNVDLTSSWLKTRQLVAYPNTYYRQRFSRSTPPPPPKHYGSRPYTDRLCIINCVPRIILAPSSSSLTRRLKISRYLQHCLHTHSIYMALPSLLIHSITRNCFK